jgi:hypothetical protein
MNDPRNGQPAIGKALTVECPRCFVSGEQYCPDEKGHKVPPHVERARTARWIEMFKL